MILHSVRIGIRSVHVRTDDRDAQELERVHETVRFVTRMLNRHRDKTFGLIMVLVAFLGSMANTLLTMPPGPPRVIIPLVAFGLTSAIGWLLIGHVVQQRQLADAVRLQTLTAESIRCRDFVIECEKASPALSRIIYYNRIRRPQTA